MRCSSTPLEASMSLVTRDPERHQGMVSPEHTEHYNSFEHWVTTAREVLFAFLSELEKEKMQSFSKKEPYVFFEVVKKGQLQLRPEDRHLRCFDA